jgi:hypothetical protein
LRLVRLWKFEGGETYVVGTARLCGASGNRSDVETKVNRFLEGSGPLSELDNARPIYDQIEQIKKQNKALRFKLRGEHTLWKGETFRESHQSLFFAAASLLIQPTTGTTDQACCSRPARG